MNEILNTSLDSIFMEKKFSWLPWLGKDYFDQKNRFLIIGESQYGEENPEKIKSLENEKFTRFCVQEQAVDRMKSYQTKRVKIYSNLHQIIVGNDHFPTEKLWSKISYYNFLQKSMLTVKHRPNNEDFMNSTQYFFEMLNILKPKYCLVCGVGSINSIRIKAESFNFKLTPLEYHEKISRVRPRTFNLINRDYEVELIFIQHPSHHFSYSKWRKFLTIKAQDLVKEFNF